MSGHDYPDPNTRRMLSEALRIEAEQRANAFDRIAEQKEALAASYKLAGNEIGRREAVYRAAMARACAEGIRKAISNGGN
jgi:phage gp16-like protein